MNTTVASALDEALISPALYPLPANQFDIPLLRRYNGNVPTRYYTAQPPHKGTDVHLKNGSLWRRCL